MTDKETGIINDCYNNHNGKCFFDGKPCKKPKGDECSNDK